MLEELCAKKPAKIMGKYDVVRQYVELWKHQIKIYE
jgi:hypothetical protein